MWVIRVIHPVLMSREIITITWKADSVCAVYIIDKIRPEMICNLRVIPRRNPMFHMNEIDEGVGRSNSDFFTILKIGLFFDSCFFIRMKKRLFGLGDARDLRWPIMLGLRLLLLPLVMSLLKILSFSLLIFFLFGLVM